MRGEKRVQGVLFCIFADLGIYRSVRLSIVWENGLCGGGVSWVGVRGREE